MLIIVCFVAAYLYIDNKRMNKQRDAQMMKQFEEQFNNVVKAYSSMENVIRENTVAIKENGSTLVKTNVLLDRMERRP